jgi:hypothetical protein
MVVCVFLLLENTVQPCPTLGASVAMDDAGIASQQLAFFCYALSVGLWLHINNKLQPQ